MNTGHGMIWPLAAEYARRGWAVRRAGWSNIVTNPFNQASSLRWIIHHSGLFHLTYFNRGDDFLVGPVTRVVRNTDFGVDEFHADDWTVFPPGCSATPANDQQGKPYYPIDADDEPFFDPVIPGRSGDSCPDVPPLVNPPRTNCDELECPPPPVCGPNFKLVTGGFGRCGCRVYLCQPTFCPDPPQCPPNHQLLYLGMNDLGCPIWGCEENLCADDIPTCPPGASLHQTGVDENGCQQLQCLQYESCDKDEFEENPLIPRILRVIGSTTEPGVAERGSSVVYKIHATNTIRYDTSRLPYGFELNHQTGVISVIPGMRPQTGQFAMLAYATNEICTATTTFTMNVDFHNDDSSGVDNGGGGFGGGGGGNGGGGRRPPKPPPNRDAAQIIIEDVEWTPQCFSGNSVPPHSIQLGFRISLGPAPNNHADGIYWVSIWVQGKRIDQTTFTPGQSRDYSMPVTNFPGGNVIIRANAYLPIKQLQSNARHEFDFPDFCKLDGCTNPFAANYDPQANDDDGTCVTCASTGLCDPFDDDDEDNCNPVGNGCCDGFCETLDDCSPSFRGSFTAANGIYYPSCFG